RSVISGASVLGRPGDRPSDLGRRLVATSCVYPFWRRSSTVTARTRSSFPKERERYEFVLTVVNGNCILSLMTTNEFLATLPAALDLDARIENNGNVLAKQIRADLAAAVKAGLL